MGSFLNGSLLDASQVAECIMLGSMLAFALQYLLLGSWWREPIGWSIAIERLAFIALLGLLLAQNYVPFSAEADNALLFVEASLLLLASVGINIGNVVMWRMRRKPSTRVRAQHAKPR